MNTKFISLYNLSHYDKNIKNVIDTKVQELNIPSKVSELEMIAILYHLMLRNK